MPKIGYHVSSAGGYHKSIGHAIKLDLETFQVFLGSPRTWKYRDPDSKDVDAFKRGIKENGFDATVAHLSYLPNPSTPKSNNDLRRKTLNSFKTEIKLADILEINYLVFHIGSHKGLGFESAGPMVADTINQMIELEPEVNLLLETSAGGSNSVGSTFDEIGKILDMVDDLAKVGVCFDTCHVFAAGYDLRSNIAVHNTLDKFDDFIGLNKLKVIHANDSKGELGQGKDRHEHIGKGYIGKEGFRSLLNHNRLSNVPFILETQTDGVENDITLLKKLRG